MCGGVCRGMCRGMRRGMCVDMRIDMCMGACIDMCMGMRANRCVHMVVWGTSLGEVRHVRHKIEHVNREERRAEAIGLL